MILSTNAQSSGQSSNVICKSFYPTNRNHSFSLENNCIAFCASVICSRRNPHVYTTGIIDLLEAPDDQDLDIFMIDLTRQANPYISVGYLNGRSNPKTFGMTYGDFYDYTFAVIQFLQSN